MKYHLSNHPLLPRALLPLSNTLSVISVCAQKFECRMKKTLQYDLGGGNTSQPAGITLRWSLVSHDLLNCTDRYLLSSLTRVHPYSFLKQSHTYTCQFTVKQLVLISCFRTFLCHLKPSSLGNWTLVILQIAQNELLFYFGCKTPWVQI